LERAPGVQRDDAIHGNRGASFEANRLAFIGGIFCLPRGKKGESRCSRLERRQMFGFPAAFANRNLFFGLFENSFIIRFGEADRARFIAEYGAAIFEPMPGRKSSQTLVVPDALAAEPERLEPWIDRALRHALTLPPKPPKAKAKPAAATAAPSDSFVALVRERRSWIAAARRTNG